MHDPDAFAAGMMIFGFLGVFIGFIAWLIPVILLGIIASRLGRILQKLPPSS